MASELTTLIRYAKKQGWSVKLNRRGHYVFYDADGHRKATTGSTPGRNPRIFRNLIADLRRAGLHVPRKGERK